MDTLHDRPEHDFVNIFDSAKRPRNEEHWRVVAGRGDVYAGHYLRNVLDEHPTYRHLRYPDRLSALSAALTGAYRPTLAEAAWLVRQGFAERLSDHDRTLAEEWLDSKPFQARRERSDAYGTVYHSFAALGRSGKVPSRPTTHR